MPWHERPRLGFLLRPGIPSSLGGAMLEEKETPMNLRVTHEHENKSGSRAIFLQKVRSHSLKCPRTAGPGSGSETMPNKVSM